MQIDYTATRNIKTGHTVDTAYTINVDVQQNDLLPFQKGASQTALAGNRVHITHHDGVERQIKTTLVAASGETPDQADLEEFLNSVRQGESFLIDGASAELSILTRPFTETRRGNTFKEYSFKVRML